MSSGEKKQAGLIERFFYGTATVGERGQLVIPAKARRDYNIENGDQLLIMGHPDRKGLMVMKADSIREVLQEVIGDLQFIESQHRGAAGAARDESTADSAAARPEGE